MAIGRSALTQALVGVSLAVGLAVVLVAVRLHQPADGPRSATRAHDTASVAVDSGEIARQASASAQGLLDNPSLSANTGSPVPAPPPVLMEAIGKWVDAVNANSPEAILYAHPDAFGNAYVVLGAWYLELPREHQSIALRSLGSGWQRYLMDVAGPWDSHGAFAPGIVVMDTLGAAAEMRNGYIKIYRQPQF